MEKAQKKLDQAIKEAQGTPMCKGGKDMHHIRAVITKRNGKQTFGKGFSPTELEKAGLDKQQAHKMGIHLDIKRKSFHDENVATLKAHAEKTKAEAAAKPKTSKIETQPKKKAKS